jgi:hypothetical protein
MGPLRTALRELVRGPSCRRVARADRCLRMKPGLPSSSSFSCCGVLDLDSFELAFSLLELTTFSGAGSSDPRMASLRTAGWFQYPVPSIVAAVLGLEISGVEREVSRPRVVHRRTVLAFVPSVIGFWTGFLRPSSSSSSSSSARFWRRRRQKHRRRPRTTRAPIEPARPPTMACLRELDMWIMSEDAVESSVWDPVPAARVWLGVAVALALVMNLEVEVGEYEMEPPTGSYDKT